MPSLANLVIRNAQMRDRGSVFAFTRDTFPWGDYIQRVFDGWLADRSGRLLVAEQEGMIVGLSFVKLTKEGEVWLQGGRVDGRFRRTGIGATMVNECLRIAKNEMNAGIARVITDKSNVPPQKLFAKLGFELATEFTELLKETEAMRNRPISIDVSFADKEATQEIWDYLKGSPIFKKSSGLYTKWFVWYSLGKEDLRRFVLDEKAVIYNPGGKVRGVMLIDDTTPESKADRSIQSCYFDAGENEGVEALSSYLTNLALRKGFEKVRLWTYPETKIIEWLKRHSFTGQIEESTELVWSKHL
jgi:ribosomal protein S18 acetylase RimI-like enzyme